MTRPSVAPIAKPVGAGTVTDMVDTVSARPIKAAYVAGSKTSDDSARPTTGLRVWSSDERATLDAMAENAPVFNLKSETVEA